MRRKDDSSADPDVTKVHSEFAEPTRPQGYAGIRQPVTAAPVHPTGPGRTDSELVTDIQTALRSEGRLERGSFEVSCVDGVVTLRGVVPLEYQRQLAQACAEGCPGVLVVSNLIRAEETGTQPSADAPDPARD